MDKEEAIDCYNIGNLKNEIFEKILLSDSNRNAIKAKKAAIMMNKGIHDDSEIDNCLKSIEKIIVKTRPTHSNLSPSKYISKEEDSLNSCVLMNRFSPKILFIENSQDFIKIGKPKKRRFRCPSVQFQKRNDKVIDMNVKKIILNQKNGKIKKNGNFDSSEIYNFQHNSFIQISRAHDSYNDVQEVEFNESYHLKEI